MKSFLVGLGLGAVLGILMAPKSGRDTRDDIQELARNSYEVGRDRLQELLEQASQRAHPAFVQHRPYESEQQVMESKQLSPSANESLRNTA